MNTVAIMRFVGVMIQYLPALMQGIPGIAKALKDGVDAVERMVAENRGPSAEEWAALRSVRGSVFDSLMSDDR